MRDALRTSLLDGDPCNWDQVLPHLMRALRALPHMATQETAHYLMLGRELWLPDELYGHVPPIPEQSTQHVYLLQRDERLHQTHTVLRQRHRDV